MLMLGWGGRIRTYDPLIQNQMPYRLATPQRCVILNLILMTKEARSPSAIGWMQPLYLTIFTRLWQC
jgi:hypothetical protein